MSKHTVAAIVAGMLPVGALIGWCAAIHGAEAETAAGLIVGGVVAYYLNRRVRS